MKINSSPLLGKELAQKKNQIKKIFFYRVCGTGMGACACLAKEAGFEVAGADLSYSPPMSTYLESIDISLFDLNSLTKEKLQEFDLVIVGNSVARNSEYAKFIETSGVAYTSFPSFMGEFILKEREVIGLCGTHGKTTTTYFLAQILEKLGEDVGYFVGGIIDGRPPSRLGTSKYFVIESDEYDSAYFQKISKFRLYELKHMILTSLEFDHGDIFSDIEDIKDEFRAILNDFSGELIVNDDYPAIKELMDEYHLKKWTLYGTTSELGPYAVQTQKGKTSFEVKLEDKKLAFETNTIGLHNILNISSCIILLNKVGYSYQQIVNTIKNLSMVKRRQEERGYYKQALVIDDFAHHPKAIMLTVDGIRKKYPERKIITIFEPISATARSSVFQEEFVTALSVSDEVIMAKSQIHTTVKGATDLDVDLVVKKLNALNVNSTQVTDLDGLLFELDKRSAKDVLFLVLSNRTCLGLWESSFVKNLS